MNHHLTIVDDNMSRSLSFHLSLIHVIARGHVISGITIILMSDHVTMCDILAVVRVSVPNTGWRDGTLSAEAFRRRLW